eukprot:628362-Pleurochrysis_carterae.AAC.1
MIVTDKHGKRAKPAQKSNKVEQEAKVRAGREQRPREEDVRCWASIAQRLQMEDTASRASQMVISHLQRGDRQSQVRLDGMVVEPKR